MIKERPFAKVLEQLSAVGLRPTRQRLALAKLLFDNGHHHVTAEQLYSTACANNVKVSLATVYNTLHQFKEVGLLREVVVEAGRSYFDTNLSDHHHFFRESTGELIDISKDDIAVSNLPQPPQGTKVDSVNVIIRIRDQ